MSVEVCLLYHNLLCMAIAHTADVRILAMQMEPVSANEMYEKFVAYIREQGIHTETGEFGADMKVSLTNDGPVTIILESKN